MKHGCRTIRGLRQYIKERREFSALGNNAVECINSLIKTTQNEIGGMLIHLPLAYLGFLALIVLSKFQSIAAGHESPANAWSGVAFAAVVMIIATAIMFYRVNAILKPRLKTLLHSKQSLKW